jgi:hypothetical protein
MLTGSISLRPGGTVGPGRIPPADGLDHEVLGLLARESELHPVREWLLFIGRSAAADVADRLGRSGYLARSGGRLGWRADRWAPVDPDWAFAPLIRVRSALDPARPLSAHGPSWPGWPPGAG